MRFHIRSIRQASHELEAPFAPTMLTEVGEYSCSLYRCEGEMELHYHLEHDELLWPQDRSIELLDTEGRRTVPAGALAHVKRGWKHAAASALPAHVFLIGRGERTFATNGQHNTLSTAPPDIVAPLAPLEDVGDNLPCPLLSCDTLQLYAERVEGTGPCRRAEQDVLVIPLRGTIGVRCGGIVTTLGEWEMARIPRSAGWHLFGSAAVVWMTPEAEVLEPGGANRNERPGA